MEINADDGKALDAAESVLDVADAVRHAARSCSGADGATFVVREGATCFYVDEDAIAPLWKGQRFPIETCISGWAMLHDTTAVVPDVELDPRIPIAAYRPTFVRSLAMVPVGGPEPVAAIGVYWASRHEASRSELDAVARLAALTADVLRRVGLDDAPWAPNFTGR